MVIFGKLRSGRIDCEFKALSIRDAVSLMNVPANMIEESTSRFLKSVIAENKGTDIDEWTVEERTLSVCHYMSAIDETGANFKVTESGGVLTDYVDFESTYKEPTNKEIEVGGDSWSVTHLTGKFAESIERLYGEFEGVPTFLHWQAGRIAAQVRNQEDVNDSEISDVDEWLKERMEILLSYPENDFYLLDDFVNEANKTELHHYFDVIVDMNGGLSINPTEEAGDKDLPPARFPVSSAIHRVTKAIHGGIG